MPDFPSWRSYQEFARRVRRENRYFRDIALDKFCKTVIGTSAKRKKRIKRLAVLYRSQVGEYEGPLRPGDFDNEDQPFALLPPRMMPLRNRAIERRANPKGIPYLYLATDKATAVAESRAGCSESISVGTFQLTRDLLVVDCSLQNDESSAFYFKEPSPRKRNSAVWRDIDRAFSQPLNRSDDAADYAPTQILAELFKQSGFDGILFRSSLGTGHNVVLFDLTAAELTGCCLYEITKIKLEFEQSGNPYIVDRGKICWNTIQVVGPAEDSTARNPHEKKRELKTVS
jgi:hypothetical protein